MNYYSLTHTHNNGQTTTIFIFRSFSSIEELNNNRLLVCNILKVRFNPAGSENLLLQQINLTTVSIPPKTVLKAKQFSQHLKECIGEENLKQVNVLNAQEVDKAICHSHDFCDANVCMIEALEHLQLDWHDQDVNAIWNLAKANNFYI